MTHSHSKTYLNIRRVVRTIVGLTIITSPIWISAILLATLGIKGTV